MKTSLRGTAAPGKTCKIPHLPVIPASSKAAGKGDSKTHSNAAKESSFKEKSRVFGPYPLFKVFLIFFN